jgi:predicted Zn-dependent protease
VTALAAMGEEAFAQLKQEHSVSTDQSLTRYVNCVSSAILAHADASQNWEVVLFDDAGVNAFALPGGKIGIFTGLPNVAENQHQLATVVGHEIAHVTAWGWTTWHRPGSTLAMCDAAQAQGRRPQCQP